MGFETVIYEKSDRGIAYVTLNRPKALNAFSVQMRDDLFEILSAIRQDDEVRVVVFKGAGDKAFCAGADLKEFLTAPSVVKARGIRAIRDLWRLFLSVPQPLIAALHGYVLGSGIEIALFCDLRIASEDAIFGLPEVGLGILPGAGGTQTLPRVMGTSGALDMLLTAILMFLYWVLHASLSFGFTRALPPRAITMLFPAISLSDHERYK